MNYSKMSKEKKDAMMKEEMAHFKFCRALYKIQMDNGMYFLPEHPYSAKSWKEDYVQEIMSDKRVEMVKGDMCAFGMWQEKDGEQLLVMKPTGFMTNAVEIANELKHAMGNTSM